MTLQPVQGAVVLVGDIGGTNARLSLWRADSPTSSTELHAHTYPTSGYATFDAALAEFIKSPQVVTSPPAAAALAIAGAVDDNRCEM